MSALHTSPFQGTWYPGDASGLERVLDRCFEESQRRTGAFLYPDGIGFAVPHAGLEYSGNVAAAVYRALARQKPEHVVVLGFPHQGGLGGIAIPDVDAIETPFGVVKLARPFVEWPLVPEERVCDHSFEIQLPFLQFAGPEARISALYVGRMEPAEREQAGEVLARAWRPGMVFLASSDFTHYGRNFGHLPFPTDEHVAARLEEQDFDYIEAAGSLDPDLFWETLARRHATVCGSDPIALLASVMAKLGDRDIYQTTLDYQTSGELSGDYRHSVSYAALGYYRRGSFEVDERDQAALLESASRTLEHLRATGDRRPAPAQGGSEALGCRRGMFVSLHRGDELLGCVGNGSGRGTVREDTAELTLAAALEDTRFRPAAGVRGPIDIEISLLTPFRRVRDASLLRAGQHGAFLRQGRRAGLLLPHVATEFGWETSQFLEALARKSGLGPKSWEDPRTKLFLFEAQRFSQAGTNTQAR